MPNPFHELRERLLRAGVAPRHVRRYLAELADHLADLTAEEERAGRSRADADSAAQIRLGGMDDLFQAVIQQRQFQSLCVRAPWAAFGLGPLVLLAGAWCVSLLLLWSGWRMFLPDAETPFGVRQFGIGNLYFQLDRALYYSAPILIGWGIGLVAVRQRLKAAWPITGLVPIALLDVMAQVRASHPDGVGRIGMAFTMGATVHGISYRLLYALAILTLMALPYLAWRIREALSQSA
jgi:hypothetical protein